MILINAVQSVLSILFMIGLGYFLSCKGWFDDKSSMLITDIVVKVSLPAYMIYNLSSNYSRDKLNSLKAGLTVPYITILLCFFIGILLAKILKVLPERRGIFSSVFAFSNTIFIGLPVSIALFKEESVPFVLLYYIANTTLFWTLGAYGIRASGNSMDKKIFTIDTIRKIFSPPLIGFIIGLMCVLAGIKLPTSISETCKYVGNLTTPLSMIFIGIVIQSVRLRDIKIEKSMLVSLFGRIIIAPVCVIVLCHYLALPLLMKKVFVIQSAMPAITQISVMAKAYDADYRFGAVMVTATTIVSLVTIPFYMLLINVPGIF